MSQIWETLSDPLPFLQTYGVVAVFLLAAVERLIPILPSYIMVAFAGFAGWRGDISLTAAFAALAIGGLIGAFIVYEAGRAIGSYRAERFVARYGRGFGVRPSHYRWARASLHKRAVPVLIITQLIVTIRILSPLPSGVMQLPRLTFAWASLAGIILYTSVFFTAGAVIASLGLSLTESLASFVGGVVIFEVGAVVSAIIIQRRRRRRRQSALG